MTVDFAAEARAFAEWLVAQRGLKWRKNGAEVGGRCPRPSHEDKNPSFGYMIASSGWACSCGHGKGSELMDEIGFPRARLPEPAPPRAQPSRAAPRPAPNGNPDCIHLYAGGNRKLKFRHDDGTKTIRWEHLEGDAWIPGMKGDPGLYLVDTIRPDTELVCLCESETDADALAERGQTAIAVAYGAGKPVTQAQAKFLEGKAVAIMEHRDDAGANFAAACRDVLYAVANEVFAVLAPEPYKDVRDWILAEFPEPDEISGLIDAARAANAQYAPPEVAETLLQDLIPPLDYIIQPLLSIGNLTLLQGEPKAGKSTFALYLALCASLGRWPSGRFVAGVPTRTLFISWEDGRRRIRERLENYLRGLCEKSETPPPLDNLYIYASSTAPRIRLDPDSPSGKKTIRRLLKMTGAQLLFLDTFSHLSSKNENAKEDMQPVVDALRDILREFDVSIMLSHHTGKPSEKNPKSIAYRSRGSSVIAAAADCILDWGSRGSTNTTPCEFISKDDDSDSFLVEYKPQENGSIIWTISSPVDTSESDRYGNRKKIVEALALLAASNPAGATRAQICTQTGLHRNTVTYHLDSLADLVQRIEPETDQSGRKKAVLFLPLGHAQ